MNNGSQNLTLADAGQAGTNTPLSNRRDWQFHAERINAAWGKQVASIIETGRYLIEAHDEMERASFEAMVQQKLIVSPSTARKLIVIAHHLILTNCAHWHKWPPSWGTLYELTKLPIEVLREKLKNGSINPKLERKEVARWRNGERSNVTVNGKTIERKPSLAEQLKTAKTVIAEMRAANDGGNLFTENSSAEHIANSIANTVRTSPAKMREVARLLNNLAKEYEARIKAARPARRKRGA